MALAAPRRSPARSETLWTFGLFSVLTLLSVICVEVFRPEWYDREYEVRKQLLNARIEERPDHSLLLIVGSSRLVVGFMPERVGPRFDPEGRPVLTFNYSHFGSGPRMNLVQLHRAARDGHLPDYAVIELVPGMIVHDDLPIKEIALADIPVLWPFTNKSRLVGSSLGLRLNGIYRPRSSFLRAVAPTWETKAQNEKDPSLTPLGGDDHWARLDAPTDEQRLALTGLAIARFQKRMQNFRLDPKLIEAMQAVLDFCRLHQIRTAIVLTPEDGQFRSWYRPGAEEELQAYLDTIREQGFPVVDGRDWIEDQGLFTDPHHIGTRAAEQFTDRLVREVIDPLLRQSGRRSSERFSSLPLPGPGPSRGAGPVSRSPGAATP